MFKLDGKEITYRSKLEMLCCSALYVYPFKHNIWCRFHQNNWNETTNFNNWPLNVERPFMDGDVVVDYYTNITYKMVNGEWQEVDLEKIDCVEYIHGCI